MTFRFGLLALTASAALCYSANPASAQTHNTYTWNNTNTDVTLASSWSPGGGPPGNGGTLDNAFFNVLGTFGTTSQFNPDLTGITAPLNSTTLNSTANFTGWTFTGAGGGIEQTALTVSGPVTHTINGPNISGIAANSLGSGVPPTDLPLTITITNGATLALTGTSVANATIAPTIGLNGGTLTLDNSVTNTSGRLNTATGLFFQSGTLELKGNSAGTAFTVGALTNSNTAGLNTIRLTPGGGALSVNFNNTGTNFSTRPSTFSAFQVVATSGVLGGTGANDPKMTFTGTPQLGANGLLAASSGGTVGYFTVSDANGVDFATWNATAGVTAAGATLTSSNVTGTGGIQSGTTADRVFFTPGAGSQSATAANTSGSLRITPTAAGGTLAMGTNNLVTVALMLNGNKDFTISGTGSLSGSGTRYIYVNDANTTLSTSLVIASSSNPTNFIGPGFLVLTGTGSQNTLTTRLDFDGGTLRGNNTQLGFTGTGPGAFNFRGGVLEIQNGTGSVTTPDFTRPLSTTNTAGSVKWEGGNGGFSAFGSNATVNIGGAGATLTWNTGGFVTDGYALKFGSTQSNAVLTWQNSIALDSGTPGNYLAREINVTAGVGGDKTILAGAISGSTSTDLLKTGTGVLELAAPNTYQGNTLIQGGTLAFTGDLGAQSGNKTGNIVVGKGATLAGTATLYPSQDNNSDLKSVMVNPGGLIRGGTPISTAASDHTGTLTVMSNVTINSTSTDRGGIQFEANRTGVGTANASNILLGDGYSLNLNPGNGNKFVIDLAKTTATNSVNYNESYTVTLATVTTAGNILLNGSSLAGGTTIASSNYILQSSAFPAFSNVSLGVDSSGTNLVLTFTPVPEPATVLGIAAGALALGGFVRRRLRRGEMVGELQA